MITIEDITKLIDSYLADKSGNYTISDITHIIDVYLNNTTFNVNVTYIGEGTISITNTKTNAVQKNKDGKLTIENGEGIKLSAAGKFASYNNGYIFDHWDIIKDGKVIKTVETAEYEFIPDNDITCKATFVKSPYSYQISRVFLNNEWLDNIQIKDSYKTKDYSTMSKFLAKIKKAHPNHPIFTKRSWEGIVSEWYVHSKLYGYWLLPSSANASLADVDLEYPMWLRGKKVTDTQWIKWRDQSNFSIALDIW